MTLLLKSVWRNVLRGSNLSRSSVRSRSLSSSISEVTLMKAPDTVMTSIKTAPSATEVLAAVQDHLPTVTHKHLLQALRSLFELHKAGKFDDDPEVLIKDPAFSVLCQNFKKHARALEVNEAIEATKVLSYLHVPVDSLIVQTMLQLIRYNINLLSLRQIMFLDFILSKFEKENHLVDALRLALPLAFQIHLPLELDNQDLPLLRDMLAYCCTHDLPDRCTNNVVTGLLLHDQAINAQIAKSIVWSLCQVNCTEEVHPTRVQLLHISCDILTQSLDQLSYDDVLRTAAKLKGRILEKHPEYYHEQLMDAIANYVVNNDIDFERALLVSRVLSRIAHTNLNLVEYICNLAASSPTTISNARTNVLFGFVNCLSNNNYTPEQPLWSELQRQISLNPVLDAKNSALPWTKLCLELASLGHYEDKLIKRVFSEEFLEKYLSRENNVLDYLQLLTLQEAVNVFYSEEYKLPQDVLNKAKALYPLSPLADQLVKHLAQGLGGTEYVLKNVVLPSGFIADAMVCLKGGHPMQLQAPKATTGDDYKIPMETLNLPSGGIVVSIMSFSQGCFSLNSSRLRGTFRLVLGALEARGLGAVGVSAAAWRAAPPHERAPLLLRDLAHTCAQLGQRLSAV